MTQKSIRLKAFHGPDGRDIHYATALLRREPESPTSILDVDDPDSLANIGACWIFFYPAGPSRRLLEAVISRYSPNFECDKDVLFLCVNRPGKGGTYSSPVSPNQGNVPSDERRHINTACQDVVSVLDFYGIKKASLFYMCAGATYAYFFASQFPERTTGYIIGIASWVLRSDSSSTICGDANLENHITTTTPPMHSLTHRLAMKGLFGPKWMVSLLAGGFMGSVSSVFGSVPPTWIEKVWKDGLSNGEIMLYEAQYQDGGEFVDMMKWIHDDGIDESTSTFVNGVIHACGGETEGGNNDEGDARDIAVCISTQQEIGLIYKTRIPAQRQVLLWHGECDAMISIRGAEYLESMIPDATLTRVPEGTHQGVMFFFPDDAIDALNRISRDVTV
ncbi:hypothetical protein ACHAWF_018388 [Thalassiosira exigua]